MVEQTPLDPEDRLGRQIFSSKIARRLALGYYLQVIGLPTSIWGPELALSFSVDWFAGPLQEMTAVGDANARARIGNRNFYGWLVFFVHIAELHGRRVVLSPTTVPDNKFHCDLCLPITPSENYLVIKREFRRQRNKLCSDLEHHHGWQARSGGVGLLN